MSPTIFKAIHKTPKSPRGEIEITDSIQMLIDQGESLKIFKIEDFWLDIGKPWDLLDANQYFLNRFELVNSGIIEKNVLENNKKGIIIHLWSNSSWIYTNCFINQTEYAIVIDESCFLSMIYQNNFINNNPNGALFLEMGYAQAFDTETNLWYNKETNIGNYWSDLLWYEGVIYDIDGGNNTDPYPLENPVSI